MMHEAQYPRDPHEAGTNFETDPYDTTAYAEAAEEPAITDTTMEVHETPSLEPELDTEPFQVMQHLDSSRYGEGDAGFIRQALVESHLRQIEAAALPVPPEATRESAKAELFETLDMTEGRYKLNSTFSGLHGQWKSETQLSSDDVPGPGYVANIDAFVPLDGLSDEQIAEIGKAISVVRLRNTDTSLPEPLTDSELLGVAGHEYVSDGARYYDYEHDPAVRQELSIALGALLCSAPDASVNAKVYVAPTPTMRGGQIFEIRMADREFDHGEITPDDQQLAGLRVLTQLLRQGSPRS